MIKTFITALANMLSAIYALLKIFGEDDIKSNGREVEEGLDMAWDELARQLREFIENQGG